MHCINLKSEYGDKFRVTDDGTDDSCREERIWCMQIVGKYGTIYPYNQNSMAIFSLSRNMHKKFDSIGLVSLQGHKSALERSWLLPKEMFEKMVLMIKAKKRKQLNDIQKKRLADALKNWRESGKAVEPDDSKAVKPFLAGT